MADLYLEPLDEAPAGAGGLYLEPLPDEPGSFIPEAGKAVASGVVETTGTGLKGMAGQQALVASEEEQISKDRQALFDRIDRGEDLGDVPYRDAKAVRDYQAMSPEARAQARREYRRAETVMKPGDIRDYALFKAGQATQDWSRETFKPAADYENSWTQLIGQGLGSTLPFLVMGTMGGLAGGSLISAGQQIDDALAKGADERQVLDAIRYGQLPGLTEQAPIELLFS